MPFTRRRFVQVATMGCAGSLIRVPAHASTPVATPRPVSPSLLISAEVLAHTGDPVQRVAVMPRQTFDKAHLADSVVLDWAELELAETTEEAVAEWTSRTAELVAVRGVRADLPVVPYDEGSLFAARGWWQLAYLGYDLPRVLDGGLPAWTQAGEPVETGADAISAIEAPLLTGATVRRQLLATKDDVLAALDDPDVLLVDARSSDEYATGHIPSAEHVLYTDNAAMNVPTYKDPAVLRGMYEDIGMDPGRRAITYCSTSARGAVAFFSLLLAGFTDVALYVGSWNEWGSDPDTPKETG